jgi:hypothetical protein
MQRFMDFTMGQERQHEKKLLAKSRDAHEKSRVDLSTTIS